MAGRRCPGKDERDGRTRACPTILTSGERYCPRHARQYERRRGSATTRGYDTQHRALRTDWQRRIDAGETVMCADGCGTRITARTWQLGHDHQRGGYLGPQTIACNTREGGRRGRATQT
jgi:hypothetical protein